MYRFFCYTVLFQLLAFTSQAMPVVKDHKPLATIVLDPQASPAIKQAASVLQHYIQQSTGALLPIATTATGNTIEIGRTAYVKQQQIGNTGLDEDGFVLQGTDASHFVIVGGSDWGTEFGIYAWLERYVGVRWLMPSDIGEDVPTHASLETPADKITDNPVYVSRELYPIAIGATTDLGKWGRYNRARGRIRTEHNMDNLVPVKKYGRQHPEFFPTVKGRRYIPKDSTDYDWQPDFSAAGLADASSQEVSTYFKTHPTATSYSLSVNDSRNFSDNAQGARKNTFGLADASTAYYNWANGVAKQVSPQFPGKRFGLLAYNNVSDPPSIKLDASIVPFLTFERLQWADPARAARDQGLTSQWGQVATSLGWYDYAYGYTYMLPRVYPHLMQQYLNWGAAHQVKYYFAEVFPNWGEGPKVWVLTKLLWNPHQNVDSLLNDWYVHAAGPAAAPKLKAYYALWEQFWTKDIFSNKQSQWLNNGGPYLPFAVPNYLLAVPDDYLGTSDKLLTDALALADTPKHKALVAKLQQMWQFYKTSAIAYRSRATLKAGNGDVNYSATMKQYKMNASPAPAGRSAAKQRGEMLETLKNDPLYSLPTKYLLQQHFGHEWERDLQ